MSDFLQKTLEAMQNGFRSGANPLLDSYLQASAPVPFSMGILCARYEDANFVLRSRDFGRTYWFGLEAIHGPSIRNEYAFQVMEHWLVDLNPPAHTRLRKLMQPSFSSSTIDGLRGIISDIADKLIVSLKYKGEFDLVQDFALPLPVLVICRMLGIPSDDCESFMKNPMVDARLLDPLPFQREFLDVANEKFAALRDYFYPLFEMRRQNPRDDLISMMVHEQCEGDRLSEEELLANVILLFFAGHETTTSLIATGLRELFLHPQQLALLRENYSLMENAVFEMLRMVSVAQMTIYTALKDCDVNGMAVKQSQAVWCWLAGANRDPRIFARPHELDITRDNAKKLLAFGSGIHYCLGAHLAKLEAMIAIEKLLCAFPKLTLHDLDAPRFRNSLSLKALEGQRATIC